jgi:hypothetical protein
MDTIKLVAEQRHFFTADVELADYGRVMLVGDQPAVERVLALIGQHGDHDLRLVGPDQK